LNALAAAPVDRTLVSELAQLYPHVTRRAALADDLRMADDRIV